MRPTLFLLAFNSLFAISLSAQDKTEHYWGKKGYDIAYSVAATNDGGYILTGLTQSMVDTSGDIVVIKTNAHGDTMWTMVYGGPLLEGGNHVMQTADGGYMITGHTEDFGAEDCDAFLMKLDANGNHEWFRVYGGIQDDIGEGVIELPTGEFVIAGITASYGNADTSSEVRHVYFIKTTSTGDTVWTKYYAGKGSEYAYSIASVASGGFLAVGYTTSFGNGEMDGWLLRLKDNGDTLWTRRHQNVRDTRYFKILPTIDRGYIIAGFTTQTATCQPQGLAVKLDANGNELWEKTYGDTVQNIFFNDVVQLPTGNFIFAGTSYASDPLGSMYLLTTDAEGNFISGQLYGGNNSLSQCIAAQGNNGFMAAGIATRPGGNDGDLYYMEIDNTTTGIPGVSTMWPHIYPNPVKDQPAIIILPASEADQNIDMDILDISGRLVVNKSNMLAKDIVIDREVLPAGPYLYHITCKDGKEYKGKFIVE